MGLLNLINQEKKIADLKEKLKESDKNLQDRTALASDDMHRINKMRPLAPETVELVAALEKAAKEGASLRTVENGKIGSVGFEVEVDKIFDRDQIFVIPKDPAKQSVSEDFKIDVFLDPKEELARGMDKVLLRINLMSARGRESQKVRFDSPAMCMKTLEESGNLSYFQKEKENQDFGLSPWL
jgi:hypothetical protein